MVKHRNEIGAGVWGVGKGRWCGGCGGQVTNCHRAAEKLTVAQRVKNIPEF